MKDEKTSQENPTIPEDEVHSPSEADDLGGQSKEEYRNEEKLFYKPYLLQQSSVRFSSTYLSESTNHDMLPNSYMSSSLNTELATYSVDAQKSSRSSSTIFDRTDKINSGSPSVSVLQKPLSIPSAILTPQPTILGEGEDYFHSMFYDSERCLPHSEFSDRNKILFPDEATISKSSALGDIKIVEVSDNGLFVKIINSSPNKELVIEGHILQQNVNGHAVSSYKFHPNIRMPASATATVWAASSGVKHQPPSDFLWKDQDRIITSPNCTTILCNPNGEAIAWYTPIHLKQAWDGFDSNKNSRWPLAISSPKPPVSSQRETASKLINAKQDQQTIPVLEKQVQAFLKREKEIPPTLFPSRSPWGLSQSCSVHPNYSLFRPLTVGNDGNILCRQSRSQSTRPDPISEPYILPAGTKKKSKNKTMNPNPLNHKNDRKSAPSAGEEEIQI
ncbi:lamin tail domain-containing protein 1 isoform X2 [Macrotis lagotis]|uniref:lamin tail domain-containing protein 1 isoform X2 n=1 Tax=Macrotis lagotis TaxID=92651 RepID=UPI003D693014